MWTEIEFEELEKITLDETVLSDFLTQNEIDCIVENSTRFTNLKSKVLIPKHKKPVSWYTVILIFISFFQSKTVRVQKLMYNVNFHDFLTKYFNSLRHQNMIVHIGFSFLMQNQKTQDMIYVYESKSLAKMFKIGDKVCCFR